MSKTKKLSIHSDNILPIIKKWLYSNKDIFLRELVSNSCDAINKLKILEKQNLLENKEPYKIEIFIDKEKKTLTIKDNGIGMDEEEIEKYISQIAFSGAKDFLEKYKLKDEFIGHFGLGFYSSYMVAKKVDIKTLSYKKTAKAILWSSDGNSEYTTEEISLDKRQTEITLFIDNESLEFLEEDKIENILKKYCPYLPFDIFLNNKLINDKKEPLWLKTPSSITEKEYISFYHELYPEDLNNPIFWIHLNVDFPFHLKGVLYFPKIKNFDISNSNIKLFCNRVFVSDDCKDILPEYLTMLKGALESPNIPLNVSRSYLQVDSNVKKIASHISKKITDRLKNLFNLEKEKFISYYPDIEPIIKIAILQDETFYEKAKTFLIWKNEKNLWTTLEEYIERNSEKTKNTIFYTNEKDSHFLDFYKEKNIEVLILSNVYLDNHLITFLEKKLHPAKFQRIDGKISESITDPSKEKNLLDAEGKTESSKIEKLVQDSLSKETKVIAKSLASSSIYGFIMQKEEERRLKELLSLQNQEIPSEKTFVINTNSKIIEKTYKLSSKNPSLAKKIIKKLYNTSLLSQKELEPKKLKELISHSLTVLEELLDLKN